MTKHHIYPKRFFGTKGPKQPLCRQCHDEIERMIPFKLKLTKEDYRNILEDFLILKRGLAAQA